MKVWSGKEDPEPCPDLEELFTKVVFSGMSKIGNKKDQMYQIYFFELANVSPISDLNEQQLLFVCSHIFKLNKAKCVHIKPQKGGPIPKPVAGRDCPWFGLKIINLKEERSLCNCSCCGAPILKRLDMKEVWHKQDSKIIISFCLSGVIQVGLGETKTIFSLHEIYP